MVFPAKAPRGDSWGFFILVASSQWLVASSQCPVASVQ